MRRVLLVTLLLPAALAAAAACDDNPRYVYTARRFDPAKGCLDDYRAIETLPGDDVSVRCREACLTVGETVYVSPVCPPLPANATELDDSAPECQAALDASRMEASCVAAEGEGDGSEEEDGGDDGGAEGDASGGEDAGIVQDAAEEG